MPRFHKPHYEVIAEVLRRNQDISADAVEQYHKIRDALIEVFAQDNAAFNTNSFMLATIPRGSANELHTRIRLSTPRPLRVNTLRGQSIPAHNICCECMNRNHCELREHHLLPVTSCDNFEYEDEYRPNDVNRLAAEAYERLGRPEF
jgi:hypothetical protein